MFSLLTGSTATFTLPSVSTTATLTARKVKPSELDTSAHIADEAPCAVVQSVFGAILLDNFHHQVFDCSVNFGVCVSLAYYLVVVS